MLRRRDADAACLESRVFAPSFRARTLAGQPVPLFFLVGFIEIVSICIRPFTLSVRLFGNIFGGENLLHATGFVFPFYLLEALVGFVQALVFTLLLSVYIGLICNHGDDHHSHEEAPH